MLVPALVPLLLCLVFYTGESSKILGVFPSPGYSQFILGERLMSELANRGHEVTVISPFPPKTAVKNYKTILVDGILKMFEGELNEIFRLLTGDFLFFLAFNVRYSKKLM